MMRRIPLVAALAIGALAVLAASAADVTLVLKSGERHAGALVYHRDANIAVVEGGQEKSFPQSDVAMIAYVPGDPSMDELSKLPAGDNPPELDRNTVVTRSGEMIRGKVYSWEGDQVIFDTRDGRRTFNSTDIARLYMSAAGARSVFNYVAPSGATASTASPTGPAVFVDATKQWTDTGITVRAGDRVSFSTSDKVHISAPTEVGPEGDQMVSGRRSYAVPNAGPGTLVGRVGSGRAFLIGNNTNPIVMPSNGRLSLGVNDDNYKDNSGGFNVVVVKQ
jgi:hypothetical protein